MDSGEPSKPERLASTTTGRFPLALVIARATFLLDKGANPRAKDEQGLTLVHAAAISGNSEILARTLALKLDVNARHTERGATPLDWAIASKDGGAAESLRSAGAKTGWQLDIAPR